MVFLFILLGSAPFTTLMSICRGMENCPASSQQAASAAPETPLSGIFTPASGAIWPLVVRSDIVVLGKLRIQGKRIYDLLPGNPRGIDLAIAVDEVIKGRTEGPLMARFFAYPMDSPSDPRALTDMINGAPTLFFLIRADGSPGESKSFTGYVPHALQAFDAQRVEQIREETRRQADILADFGQLFPREKEPLYEEVKRLIDATTNKDTQAQAFARIEDLGVRAVPALIMLMDDRRCLGAKSLSLRNRSPTAFEGFRHYGPETVVDAAAALLNQITRRDFGSIYSGGSEQQRQKTINGWRMYLYYMKYGYQPSPPSEMGTEGDRTCQPVHPQPIDRSSS